MIRHVQNVVNGKIPVIAGTGEVSTQATLELTLAAEEIGVDGCLIMTPPYIRPTQEGLFQHYKTIATQAAIPQIIYNVPSRTACDMLPETIARLADVPNIVGVKEATGKVERIQQILALCGQRLDIYSGDDHTAMALLEAGAKGVISVTANIAPKLMHEMCQAALKGDFAGARQLNEKLMPLHNAIMLETNPIPSKWALHTMGLIGLGIRLPLTPLAQQYHETMRQAMIVAGVL